MANTAPSNNPLTSQSSATTNPDGSKIVVDGIDLTDFVKLVNETTFADRPATPLAQTIVPLTGSPLTSLPVLDWPPGGAGHLAKLLFEMAVRPVKDVAIATALATLAGMCGRAWITPTGAGLNLYIVFIGRSGIGKEAIADGISKLLAAAANRGGQMIASFFCFDSIASGQALVKLLAMNSCFLQIAGEFGHDVVFMSVDKTGPFATLRQQFVKLYSKSGLTSIAGGIRYSNAENSVSSLGSASYSMIGETTPGTFFEALNGSMMSDGFLSRFLILEYDGPRPTENRTPSGVSDAWADWLSRLALTAYRQLSPVTVATTYEALQALDAFGLECDLNINATNDEARRQMWNRAQLKALKVSSLLAVADDMAKPIVSLQHALWSVNLVKLDISRMAARLDRGDVGDDDHARRQKVLFCLQDWMQQTLAETYAKRKGWTEMRQAGTVPRVYLTNRLQSLPAFRNQRLGAVAAIDSVLNSLIKDGILRPVERSRGAETFGFHGDAFRILRLD